MGGVTAQGVLLLTTQALEAALEGQDARSPFCRGAASLFHASAAAHVRYDAGCSLSRLCMWRIERPNVASVVTLEQPEPDACGESTDRDQRDWWLRSAMRTTVLGWLSRNHLVELPLAVEAPRSSLLLLGRGEPFTEEETARLARTRHHLLVLDRVLQRLEDATEATVPSVHGGSADGEATEAGLTAREREVLTMLSEGLLARSIAQRLAVSERTVHKHLGNLYKKLDAHDRLLAVRRAEDLGLLPAPRGSGEQDSRADAGASARW